MYIITIYKCVKILTINILYICIYFIIIIGCAVKQYALTLDLLKEHKDRIKVKRTIDTLGVHNHQLVKPFLDDSLKPDDRYVEFELTDLKSDFGVTQNKGNNEEVEGEVAVEQDEKNNQNPNGDKYSISFAEQKNGPELREFVDIFDDICIEQGVLHSETWFGKKCSKEIVSEKFTSILKAPTKASSAEKYGKSVKMSIDRKRLKPTDIFLNGEQADSFESITNLKNASYTLRFRFEKLWFGESRRVYSAKLVVTRILVIEAEEEGDQGFSTVAVQYKNNNSNNNSTGNSNSSSSNSSNAPSSSTGTSNGTSLPESTNSNSGSAPQDNNETSMPLLDAGSKRSPEQAFENPSVNNSEFADVPFTDKDPTFTSSPKRMCTPSIEPEQNSF